MLRRNLLLAAPAALLQPLAWAHGDKSKTAPAAANGPAAAGPSSGGTRDAAAYFTNLELLTQEGRKVRFYADVLAGKTVLINVIYTNCGDACPLITQVLNDVRGRLPEFGKEIHFVTLSSDPARDTPFAMKEFAKKQGADVPGWTWLTGRAENLEHILKKLGMYSPEVESHSTLLIGGNVPAKRWSKIRPDATPVAIATRLRLLAFGDNVPLPGSPEAKS